MKAPPKYSHEFFIILIISFFTSYVYSQASDSCNSPLTLQSPIPFQTTSLRCVTVWPSQNFILRYEQAPSSTNVWNFVLSAPKTNAYIGMGFSPNGNMVGSNAIVGWVGGDGTSNMQKYFLGGKSPNLVTIEQPNQGLQIANSSMLVQSNQVYMAFQLITNSPGTRLIYSVGQTGRLPVGPNFQLAQHETMISTILNYGTGQFESQKSPESSLRRSHGLLNMLGWSILIPIGAMVARYMKKWDPIWFYSHAIIQSLGFTLGLSGVICGLVLENRLNVSVSKHKGIGITILILGCLQVIAILARPDMTSKVRKYWNWYHFGVGRTLMFLAAVNVFYGIHLGKAGTSWNASFAVVLTIFFLITLIFELRRIFTK